MGLQETTSWSSVSQHRQNDKCGQLLHWLGVWRLNRSLHLNVDASSRSPEKPPLLAINTVYRLIIDPIVEWRNQSTSIGKLDYKLNFWIFVFLSRKLKNEFKYFNISHLTPLIFFFTERTVFLCYSTVFAFSCIANRPHVISYIVHVQNLTKPCEFYQNFHSEFDKSNKYKETNT